jgi:hypothetical protein
MVLEPRPSPIFFETLLDKERAGNTEPDAISFSFLKLADGLFVVVNMPPTAFVVRAGEVKPLPGFFAGLRSPSPDWPPEMFYVSSLSGTLDPLSFDIYAPATEYRDGVSGKPGRWKTRSGRRTGAKATQPAWVVPETISEPLTTQKGARLYEVAPEAFAPARVGFSFRFDGPARGEKLPVPAPGTNGCRFAVLGHPLLTQNADGSLMGLGTLCTSGDDEISTSKLDGIAPPFQWISPRLTHGQLAVERWVDGKSVVLPLPGAERVADFAPFDFVRVAKPGGESLYVASQVVGAKGNEGYLAEFDGAGFRNVTPPGPPGALQDVRLLHERPLPPPPSGQLPPPRRRVAADRAAALQGLRQGLDELRRRDVDRAPAPPRRRRLSVDARERRRGRQPGSARGGPLHRRDAPSPR